MSSKDYKDKVALVERVREINNGMSGVQTLWEDDLAFISMNFLGKQDLHVQSLLDLGGARDSVLIIRSMLEGWSQLLWVIEGIEGFTEPEELDRLLPGASERAALWRNSWGVTAWVEMAKVHPDQIPTAARLQWNDWFELHASTYLTRAAKKKALTAESIRDFPGKPFKTEWNSLKLKGTLNESYRDAVYGLYSEFSRWQHWDAGMFNSCAAEREGGRGLLGELDSSELFKVWSLAYLFLLDTSKVASAVLDNREVNAALRELGR